MLFAPYSPLRSLRLLGAHSLRSFARSLWRSVRSLGAHLLTHFVRSLARFGALFGRFGTHLLTHFVSLLAGFGAPFGRFCNMCLLTSFVRTCSKSFLWSLNPTCAHSLRSLALVAYFVRSLKGCSVGGYCKLQVVFTLC